jgi:hypothetical protein
LRAPKEIIVTIKQKKPHRCGCIRRPPGRPKLASSLCHGAGGYHPSVVERIRGARLCRAWIAALSADEPDDIDL